MPIALQINKSAMTGGSRTDGGATSALVPAAQPDTQGPSLKVAALQTSATSEPRFQSDRHDKVASNRQVLQSSRGPGLARKLWRAPWFIAARAFAAFVLLWALMAVWVDSPIQMPSPAKVFAAMGSLAQKGELWSHTAISAGRLSIALLVATLAAVPLGFAMALSREINTYIDPLVELLRPISGIAWIPLALFIFGVGGTLPVFIMAYVAFFPLLLNTIAGVRDVDAKLLAVARTMGVAPHARLLHVVVPAALPSVMVGFRIAFASAWAAIIAAELIGSPSGLGFAIEWYRQLLMSPKVFSFIVVIGLLGYLSDLALRAMQHKLTPWVDRVGEGQ